MSHPPDSRLEELLEVMLAFARQDFSRRAPISDRRDTVDALAVGLNMLAEELDGEVASRRELESAYRSLRDAQAQLVHAGKLAAVGQLASGVVHEINNPAQWVVHALEDITRGTREAEAALVGAPSFPEAEALRRALRTIAVATTDAMAGLERIRTVAGDLRTFSRADGEQHETLALHQVARAAVQLARPLLQTRASLELRLAEAFVLGNSGRLGQVVTNLLVNAAQSFGPNPVRPPLILLETGETDGVATIAVEDSGPVVALALRERVFEPFFTTKGPDQGTGLGLSLVADIVQRHHGTVRVTDGALGGARFEVRLPSASGARRDAGLGALAQAGRARVLIVDDEPNLLRSYKLLLQGDHDVCLARSGTEALALLSADRDFDVVLCDLRMPDMDGLAVHEALKTLAPGLLRAMVIFTGGGCDGGLLSRLQASGLEVVEKPVPAQRLLDIIARAASRREPARL